MTVDQAKGLRKLAKQVGKDADALAQKFLECDFDELSIEGAAYLKYRIEKKIKKARDEDPDAFPEPKEEVKKKKAPAPVDEDEDDEDSEDEDEDWGSADAPKASHKSTKKQSKKSDDDEDDDEF